MKQVAALAPLALFAACAATPTYDVVLRGGTVYDGEGGPPYVADVALRGDRVAAIGELGDARGARELDVTGLAVAPGFINVLSWSVESLIQDGRSLSEIAQGVTLEVFGEGESWGPWNAEMKAEALRHQGDIRYDIEWTTLAGYLDWLAARGVSPNIASFVGAATVRVHELGQVDRAPTPEELERMRALVAAAMEDGALGVASALIYAPGTYAETDELVALAEVVARYGGRYMTHMRSEGDRLLEGVEETIEIARRAGVGAEIYHLKAAGEANWPKLDEVIARVEAARAAGLDLTADMYTYTAGATGLDAAMPPWVQEGGYDAWAERLRDPEARARVAREMRAPAADWESLLLAAGDPSRVLLVDFKNPELRGYVGKTLAEVAAQRGTSVEETAMDLVVEDGSRVGVVYFLMSEANVERQIALPWVSFCSDSASQAPEPPFTAANPHPRAYGSFARLLGRYVRERELIPLEEAVRRLTSLPADNLRLEDRGRLRPGAYADVVVFDPATIADHATYAAPHQLATGVEHVFVNGDAVWRDGAHTGATPGRVVSGPGWTGVD